MYMQYVLNVLLQKYWITGDLAPKSISPQPDQKLISPHICLKKEKKTVFLTSGWGLIDFWLGANQLGQGLKLRFPGRQCD